MHLGNKLIICSAPEHDTVGAVAVGCHGNVAVATSTGGITAKLPGRMGDSAIVGRYISLKDQHSVFKRTCIYFLFAGGGGYADNDVGAVSTTGHGESLMKTCAARHAAFLMESGDDRHFYKATSRLKSMELMK
jgi:beta-aspartyl-peptidase (threonine type)